MHARFIWILAGAAAALALIPAASSRAGSGPDARASSRPAGTHVPVASAAELIPRLALSSGVVQVTSRYGVGFISGRCNEPERDFCSLAARLYHTLSANSKRQVRIGTVAGTAPGGASGRLGFIMNIPGWRLLRTRRYLTVTLRGTIVHGEMLTGIVDRKIDLSLVR